MSSYSQPTHQGQDASNDPKCVHLYVDLMSQPSRAVYWFCLLNKLPVKLELIQLARLQHKTPEFLQINPMGKVPAISDENLSMFESHAILRYLCRKFKSVTGAWYPESTDAIATARIDEYLSWHEPNLRMGVARFVRIKYLVPLVWKIKPNREESVPGYVESLEKSMHAALKFLENYFLKTVSSSGKRWIGGMPAASIADLSAYEELAQLKGLMPEYWLEKVSKDSYPNINAWMSQIEELSHYGSVHAALGKVYKKFGSYTGATTQSKL